ncbi:MAG TPA: class I tRNA ligase family protein, partial [Promineifilum sp.]
GEAGRRTYEFLWDDFADWYVEIAKVQLAKSRPGAWTTLQVLVTVLDQALRLLHPYIPFVTEETWQQLRAAALEADLGIAPAEGWAEALIISDWPRPDMWAAGETSDFELVRDLVRRIRNARAEHGVEPGKHIPALIAAGDNLTYLEAQRPILVALARLDDQALTLAEAVTPPVQAITLAMGSVTCYLPLAGLVDRAVEKARLESEAAEMAAQIERLTALLAGPFADKAPAAVVSKEREKLAALEAGRREIGDRLAALAGEI